MNMSTSCYDHMWSMVYVSNLYSKTIGFRHMMVGRCEPGRQAALSPGWEGQKLRSSLEVLLQCQDTFDEDHHDNDDNDDDDDDGGDDESSMIQLQCQDIFDQDDEMEEGWASIAPGTANPRHRSCWTVSDAWNAKNIFDPLKIPPKFQFGYF